MKPKLFIASSVEGIDLAYAVQQNLRHVAEGTVWDQGVFQLSRTGLESLIAVLNRSDFGVFVFSPDDIVKMRDKEDAAVRDNVVLELGLFVGRLGKERCFILAPEKTELHIASDLVGMTPATYETGRSDGNTQAACGPACNEIRLAIQRLGLFPGSLRRQDGAPQKGEGDQADSAGETRESWIDAYWAREFDKAVALLEAEIATCADESDKAFKRSLIGTIQFSQDPVGGAAYFEASIKTHPKDTGLYATFANSNLWQDRFDECLTVVDRGLKAGAEAAELIPIKARCLARMGNRPAAIKSLESEVAKTPSPKVYLAIAEFYQESKENEGVLDAIIAGLRAFPTDESLLSRYGQILQASGNNIGAVRVYQQLVSINDRNATYPAYLGNAYLNLSLNSLALEAYRRANELADAKQSWIIANIGNLMNNRGLYSDALKHLDDALKLDPNSSYSHQRIATALASKEAEDAQLAQLLASAPPLLTPPSPAAKTVVNAVPL
jgi:tetratricopeptide (TPR) repeat protein